MSDIDADHEESLEENTYYTVVLPSYIGNGGDGF